MILGFTPLEIIFNVIFYMEFCVFLHHVLIPRFSGKWMWPIYFFLSVGLIALSALFPRMTVLRILTLPVVLSVFNMIFYRDKRLRCIFVAWLVMLVIFLSEIMVVAFVYQPEMLEARLYEASLKDQIVCWLVEYISAGIMYWVISLVMNRVRNRLTVREMVMYSFFPVSQGLLLYGWLNATRLNGGDNFRLLVVFVMLICLAADAGLFASMLRLSRQTELETENRFLAAQIEAQREHYAELTAQYESIRRMRHDIAKHLNVMDELLSSGQSEAAAAYVAELQVSSYDRSLGICQHPVVDAYLHNAIRRAKETGLVLDVSVSIPADAAIADTDLVCTFGNLLDNAFEACEGLPGAVIQIRGHVAAGCLMISTENPLGEQKEKKARIRGLERGIGLRVLENLAKKYGGSFRYGMDNGSFRSEITLRLDV